MTTSATAVPSKPDAKTHPTDAGKPHDAAKDTAGEVDATTEASGAGTPCTRPTDCASLVCEPVKLVGTQDGEVFFDAGVCDDWSGASASVRAPRARTA